MSNVATKHSSNLAGGKRRSLSGQGGLLGRMFGASSGDNGVKDAKDANITVSDASGNAPDATTTPDGGDAKTPTSSNHHHVPSTHEDKDHDNSSPARKSREVSPSADKKRRSGGVNRLFNSARQSLHNLGTTSPENKAVDRVPQTPMQRLGKTDAALSVPQGSQNNSAGESHPGPRSTFRVGVTEDKNKKCRRTMEDTHAYLYNFLSTPAVNSSSTLNTPRSRSTATESIGSSTTLSPTTSQQEPVETDNGYFAIFDGHAGTFAADWCGKKVHVLLEDIIRKHPNTPIPELLDMTFTSADQQLEKLPLKNSGCTAVTAVLRWEDRIPSTHSATGSAGLGQAVAQAVAKSDGQGSEDSSLQEQELRRLASRHRVLYTANVGDARIVLCRNGKALRLSYDHKGSDENEGKRIAGAGGLILNNRVNGVLAVTRALGDAYMKDLVTGHPYTTETVIQPDIDEFLVLACDGLWDVCSDQEAVDLVRNVQDPQVASKMLVDHALARFSTDNLSCMIVRFDGKAAAHTVENTAEAIGVEGDPSTRTGGPSEADIIVRESKKKLDESGTGLARIPTELIEAEKNAEPGPELNPQALEEVRRLVEAKRGDGA